MGRLGAEKGQESRLVTLLLLVLVVVSSVVAVILVTNTANSGPDAPRPAPGLEAPGRLGETVATGAADERSLAEVERLIGVLERRVAEADDALNEQFLGQLHLRREALTGDVSSLVDAEAALERASQLSPGNAESAVLLGTAKHGLHDFAAAAELALEVLRAEPGRVDAQALLVDAQMSLGELDDAADNLATLERAAPGHPAIVARRSRLAWIRGEPEEAAELASEALAAAGDFPDLAWYHAYAGQVAFDTGRIDEAIRHFQEALALDPSEPSAIEGLARSYAGTGRYDEAVDLYMTALERGSDPHHHALLGDLFLLLGNADLAEDRYDRVEAIAAEHAALAVYDRDIALFHADRDRDVVEALRLAERDLAARRDPYAHGTHAWALYRNGRLDEARLASDRALASEVAEAAFWYHAGLISLGLGDEGRAASELQMALDLNPGFDPLLAADARERLDQLTT